MAGEKQTNYTIMEGYTLPSKGLIYDKQVDPHIELRSMTGRDEMKRLSPSTTPLKTIADIIENCMIEKPAVHVYDMAVGDYEFLLHKLRIVTYGEDYPITLKCPKCGKIFDSTAKLGELEVRYLEPEEYDKYKTITLPDSGKRVTLSVFSPRMLDDIEIKAKEQKRKYKTAEIDFDVFTKLCAGIDLINGEKPGIAAIEALLNNCTAKDFNKIRNSLDKLQQCFGIDTKLYLTCPHCKEEVQTFFRLGPDFFRPSDL